MPTVYLVIRRDSDDSHTTDTVQLAFDDLQIAETHAATATRETGVQHAVIPVALATEPPVPQYWHSMSVELLLTGVELWRREQQLVSFTGHPDEVHEASSTWRILLRETPSQPPSRVRITLLGPDRAWCIAAARRCWAQARSSAEYAEASAIEGMYAVSRTQ